METLETLFSSPARVKILRTFLFQPQTSLCANDVADRAGVATSTARAHASDLVSIGLLHEVDNVREKNGQTMSGWRLNRNSDLRDPLHKIILMHQRVTPTDIAERLKKVGDIHFLVLSGIFSGSDDRPVDILMAGDNIDSTKLSRSLTRIENSFGTELRYAALSRDEFNYRFNVYDKLVRDVLDYPHHVLIDELNAT